jgi:hypothetical protein
MGLSSIGKDADRDGGIVAANFVVFPPETSEIVANRLPPDLSMAP